LESITPGITITKKESRLIRKRAKRKEKSAAELNLTCQLLIMTVWAGGQEPITPAVVPEPDGG
jgi:hypothetical protein